jgi:hypothetical protein
MQSELFYIVFDIPTPRPHFIIKYHRDNTRQRSRMKVSIKDVPEQDRRDMLSLIDKFIKTYEIPTQNMILSFHTGYWVNLKNLDLLILT